MKLAVLRAARTQVQCAECVADNLKAGYAVAAAAAMGFHSLTDIQFDHHLALVDGGAHTDDNLRPICTFHHKKKSAREHVGNSKAKRLATARAVHESAKRGEYIRPQSRLKGRGFDKALRKRMDGKVERV